MYKRQNTLTYRPSPLVLIGRCLVIASRHIKKQLEMLTNSPTRCHHRPYGKSRSPELASHETKGGVKTEANTFAVFFDALMEATCLSVMACAYPRPTTRKPKTTRYLRPHRTNLLRALDKSLRLSDAGYTIGIKCEWTYIYGLAFLRCCCGNEQLEVAADIQPSPLVNLYTVQDAKQIH